METNNDNYEDNIIALILTAIAIVGFGFGLVYLTAI